MSAIRDAIRNATLDNVVTKEEWASLKPLASSTPKEASEDARELVNLFANDKFEMPSTAKTELRSMLRERGYDAPTARPTGMSSEVFADAIISSNVTETDSNFRKLQLLSGQENATVNVGVMDTGLDTKHGGLDSKLWTNVKEIEGDGIDNDSNGFVDDIHGWDFNNKKGAVVDAEASGSAKIEGWKDEPGAARLNDTQGHGTHVSGIITQGTDAVDVMGLQVLGNNFDGKMAADAIDYAAKNGAKVINMSFRVTDPDDVKAMVEAMKAHPEVLFVASAGNDGNDINGYNADRYLKKHTLDNFVVVSAADQDGKKASYSNYGKPWATHAGIGSNVLSSTPGGKYEAMSGTSMASPNVAAAAAKAMLLDPGLTPAQVKTLLADVTQAEAQWDPLVNSAGRVDSRAAYTLAAITGVVRREGISAEAAADKLQLSTAERERLLPLVSRYVPAPVPTPEV
ncbi:MAG TPA: S8 family serine peptidase [Myxococcaceae bacterium]|nr:S8 family serine peptidase [Myxococcaceae bacterium]